MYGNTFFYPQELDKQFTYLVKLFDNLPVAEKDKKKWIEQRRYEKIFALIALYNPNLRENLPKSGREITLPVSRESQSFETLLENLETFTKQNKNPSFTDFLTLGKKSNESATLDLFSMTKENSPQTKIDTEDLSIIRQFEKNLAPQPEVSAVLWTSFCVFRHLFQNKTGIKKYGSLFADFVFQEKEKKLLNFPLIVLEAFNAIKAAKEKTFAGRRASQTSFEEISEEVFFETALSVTQKSIADLIRFYRSVSGYEQIETEQKIRINYLAEQAFILPKIYENGFSKTNESVKTLCTRGGLRKEDMKKEGALLLAEILETEQVVEKSPEPAMEWVINVSRNTKKSKWEKYNNLETILLPKVQPERKTEVKEFVVRQKVAKEATR